MGLIGKEVEIQVIGFQSGISPRARPAMINKRGKPFKAVSVEAKAEASLL